MSLLHKWPISKRFICNIKNKWREINVESSKMNNTKNEECHFFSCFHQEFVANSDMIRLDQQCHNNNKTHKIQNQP